MDWTLSSLCLLSLTFIAAGLVKGVTGLGLPTVAMGVLASAVAPAVAAAILVIPSLATNLWQALSGPATGCLLRRLWAMMIGILLGTVAASALLVRVDPLWSAFALGVALVAYAGYALALPAMSVPPHVEAWLSPGVGLATGAVTGVTGVFVMPVVPYLQALSMSKDELVQALGLSFTVSTVALAAGLVVHDAYRPDQLVLSTLATVPAFAGMWLGQRIRARTSPRLFRQCFLVFLGLLGLELCSRPLF
jgi:uncharacterized membrane protein YfcA